MTSHSEKHEVNPIFRVRRLRPLFLLILSIFIIVEIVALWPSTVDESPHSASLEPDSLIQNQEPSLVPDLPKNRIPEYNVEQFNYVSTQNGEKQWKIEATKAYMYNQEKLVHSRGVRAFLYDPDDKATIITGSESRYFMNQKDLEIYGNVKTVFPDGFELQSEYLRYKPDLKQIEIPKAYKVHGSGNETEGQRFSFISLGLSFAMGKDLIELHKDVQFTLEKTVSSNDETVGIPETTIIESDHCFIDRKVSLAKFTMFPQRPLSSRFVYITQPTLFTRSRRADLNYGNFNNVLQYLTAYDDVLIKERTEKNDPATSKAISPKDKLGPPPLRYATGGQAVFDTKKDVILLTKYPQAYEDQDTVTGDWLRLYRDTGLIEVGKSNGFSEGSPE